MFQTQKQAELQAEIQTLQEELHKKWDIINDIKIRNENQYLSHKLRFAEDQIKITDPEIYSFLITYTINYQDAVKMQALIDDKKCTNAREAFFLHRNIDELTKQFASFERNRDIRYY